jgi:hypothetical protein
MFLRAVLFPSVALLVLITSAFDYCAFHVWDPGAPMSSTRSEIIRDLVPHHRTSAMIATYAEFIRISGDRGRCPIERSHPHRAPAKSRAGQKRIFISDSTTASPLTLRGDRRQLQATARPSPSQRRNAIAMGWSPGLSQEHLRKLALAKRVTLIGMAVSGFLSAAKLPVGWIGHSTAVFADGLKNGGDLFCLGLVLYALYVASVPPDKKHPYGHGRSETIAGREPGGPEQTTGDN